MEHVAEGQEKNRRTPQGSSLGCDGVIDYFTVSELGDRGGCQKTITTSSLRYEDQIEVRHPPATLWVVLRNQLLIAGRPHPNVDVGCHRTASSRAAFQQVTFPILAEVLRAYKGAAPLCKLL